MEDCAGYDDIQLYFHLAREELAKSSGLSIHSIFLFDHLSCTVLPFFGIGMRKKVFAHLTEMANIIVYGNVILD